MKKIVFSFFFLAPSLLKVLLFGNSPSLLSPKGRRWIIMSITFFFLPFLWKGAGVGSQVITIPTVFQVVYFDGDSVGQSVPDSMLFKQLQVLNEDFRRMNADSCSAAPWGAVAADCEIQFCLATQDPQGNPTNGITRTPTTFNQIPPGNMVKAIAPIWDRDRYLNIWVCNGDNASTFPGEPALTDGVVLYYFRIKYPATTKGRLGTLFVSRWLNLWPIDYWANCADNDSVPDTPNTTSNCFNSPPPCNLFDSCNVSVPAMCCNFQSNSVDCACLFTMGQKARMRAALTGPRASLLTSNACLPVGVQENLFNNTVNIYPNPTSGVFNVQMSKLADMQMKDIEVYNMLGERIYQSAHPHIRTSSHLQIDLSSQPDGIYFVRVNTEKGVVSKKVVVMK